MGRRVKEPRRRRAILTDSRRMFARLERWRGVLVRLPGEFG